MSTLTVADLVRAYDLERTGETTWRATHPDMTGAGFVPGGQVLAQLLVTAARSEPEKSVRTIHAFFGRPVRPGEPVELTVDVLQGGRSFTSCSVSATQDGREKARALVLLHAPEPDLIRASTQLEAISPTPEDARPAPRFLPGGETRIAAGVDPTDPSVVAPPVLGVWVRYADAPADPVVNQALLALTSARFTIPTAMLPHEGIGEAMAHKGISTGVIGLTVSFHEAVDVRDWLYLSFEGIHSGGGAVYGRAQAFDRQGRIVASFSQDAMIRAFREGTSSATHTL